LRRRAARQRSASRGSSGAAGDELDEGLVIRLVDVDGVVFDVGVAATAADVVQVLLNIFTICLTEVGGVDLELFAGLEVLEGDLAVEGEIDFGLVEEMDDEALVVAIAEMLEGVDELVGIKPEVGDEDDEGSTGEAVGQLMDALGEGGVSAGLGFFEGFEEAVEVERGRGGGQFEADLVIDGDEAGEVLLVGQEIGEAGGEVSAVVHLVGELHGHGGIEDDGSAEVGFLFVEFDVVAVGAGVGSPVEVAEFVAWDVFAMFGEFDGEAAVGGLVEAGDDAFDDLASDEL